METTSEHFICDICKKEIDPLVNSYHRYETIVNGKAMYSYMHCQCVFITAMKNNNFDEIDKDAKFFLSKHIQDKLQQGVDYELLS